VSSYFVALNRNKRCICLDLKHPAARAVLHRIVPQVDVLVHNFRPGVMERLGLGYDELSELHPGLVYAVATGFGETGPLAGMGGQDMVAQSISGIAAHSGGPAAPPHLCPTPFVDYASGMSLAQGILLALIERQRSGQGQKVSISLLDVAMAMQTLEATSQLMYAVETNWVADWFPNATFATADGWITVLGFFRDDVFARICRALEIDDSAGAAYSTPEALAAGKQELNGILAPEFSKRATADCVQRLSSVDVLCAQTLTLTDALEHAQVQHNEMVLTVPVSQQPPARTMAHPVKLSRSAATVRHGAGRLGEHTRTVLRQFEFPPDEIDRLAAAGVLGDTEYPLWDKEGS
jgi:crotonobetainyl-CoA:carnitine CoA-transferase CaiB-like acyl-CoA transferase